MISESADHEVTRLLQAWSAGHQEALEQLVPLVYEELHLLATRYMAREGGGHILETTALVHEAYLHLVDEKRASWRNRAQFFGVCAQVMRRILVDWARSRQASKRGGAAQPLRLREELVVEEPDAELVRLDDALEALAALDPRKGRVVELRFFGGLSVAEVATVLEVSPETVMRDWKFSKSWLRRELRKENTHGIRALAPN
jgi:RNA polymerase sigma factor (TIGR02999 family)